DRVARGGRDEEHADERPERGREFRPDLAPELIEPVRVPHGNADSVQARIHRNHVHGVLPHRALGPTTGTIVYRSAAGSPMSSSRLAQFVASRMDCRWL